MGIKRTIYPKTKRFSQGYQITEKLDGCNLGIANINGVLHFFQRNLIFSLNEIYNIDKCAIYKGLIDWIIENEKVLKSIRNGKIIFGEWLGMGKLDYSMLDKKYYVFSYANIDYTFNISNIEYLLDNLQYMFIDNEIPNIMDKVFEVWTIKNYDIDTDDLDMLYQDYTKKVGRQVEGFIIYDMYNNFIRKYVRYNRLGELVDYKESGGK